MKCVVAILCFFVATSASAQTREPVRIAPISPDALAAPPPAPPITPGLRATDRVTPPPGDGRIVLTREACLQMQVEHRAAPDVAYQPGVDAYGRGVAPADLPSSSQGFGQGFGQSSTDLILNTGRIRGLPRIAGLRGETYVGTVTLRGDGSVLLDGQPIGADGRSDLQALCREAYPQLRPAAAIMDSMGLLA